jgi:hypothetical protein
MSLAEFEVHRGKNISRGFISVIERLNSSPKIKRVFNIATEPSKDELQLLMDRCDKEVGINRMPKVNQWLLIEGEDNAVDVSDRVDFLSDISTHSHPDEPFALPSPGDLFTINPRGKNLIVGCEGLTGFTKIQKDPLFGLPWKPRSVVEIEAMFYLAFPTQITTKISEIEDEIMKKFYRKTGVKIVTLPWNKLPDYPLSAFPLNT